MDRRLFIALNATDPFSKSFLPIYKKLKIYADRRDFNIKWVPIENFHVTISFLGDQREERIHQIQEVLQLVTSQSAPFDLKVEGLGAFSNEHDARVLWMGVQNKKCLGELKENIDHALLEKQLILNPDQRLFQPHLTFGRLRNPRSVKDMISPFIRKSFGKIHVKELVLFESHLQGPFPVYSPLFRYPLTGTNKKDDWAPILSEVS